MERKREVLIMKKIFLTILMVAAMLFSANFAFAEDDVSVGVDNTVTNTVNSTGGNANATGGSAWQKQGQAQKQNQNQNQKQKQNTEVTTTGVNGSQTVSTPLSTNLMDAVVGPGGAETGVEVILSCNPDYQKFTIKELETMADSGRFTDKRGSFFDALTGMKVKSVIRSKKEKATYNEIHILNKVPSFVKVLGTVSCTGDYGWALDEVLSKCLLEAREKTNTSNVIVRQINDIDAANSGTAIGAGAGTSVPFRDDNVGAGAVAATFGKTHSMKERVILIEVRAYDDVFEAPDVCNPQPVIITTAPEPAPAVIPEPQVKACNPDDFDEQLKQYKNEIIWCKWPGENNAKLRFGKANTKMDKYFCKLENGEKDDQLLRDAIHEYGIAERDILNGRELAPGQKFGEKPKGIATKTLASAQELLYKVHYNWALPVRELSNVPAEITHAQKYELGKRGDGSMPEVWADIQR